MTVARRSVVGSVLLSLVVGGVARADGAPAKLVGPFAKDEYPQAVIDRPLTLPAGMVEGEVGAQFTSAILDAEPLGVRGVDAWDALVALRVGVTDRVQIEAGAAFSLDYVQRYDAFGYQGYVPPDIRPSLTSWRRVVPLRLSFLALDTESASPSRTV